MELLQPINRVTQSCSKKEKNKIKLNVHKPNELDTRVHNACRVATVGLGDVSKITGKQEHL